MKFFFETSPFCLIYAKTNPYTRILDVITVLSLFPSVFRFLFLQYLQILVQSVKALLPVAAIMLHPVSDFLERARFEPTRPPLRLATAYDQTSLLQNFEVFGDGRKAHIERPCQLGHRCLARTQPIQYRAPRRICDRSQRHAEGI